MPPFIQPASFFSPLSPAPASSSPPYSAPVRPLPTSPNRAPSSYPLPPSPTSTNNPLPSQCPTSIHTPAYSLPSPIRTNIHSQAQHNHPLPSSTFRIHPTTGSSNLRVPIAKRKPEGPETTMELAEPQRKVRNISILTHFYT